MKSEHYSTNLIRVQLLKIMMVMVMRNRMILMIHPWRRGMFLQHWWRCWLGQCVPTSSGAAFALQVSIAVWSDATGICGRKNCLVDAKSFHTALFAAWEQWPCCSCLKRNPHRKHPLCEARPFLFNAYFVLTFAYYVLFMIPFNQPSHFPKFVSTCKWTFTC